MPSIRAGIACARLGPSGPLGPVGFASNELEPFIIAWTRLPICLALDTTRESFITLAPVSNNVGQLGRTTHTLTRRLRQVAQPVLRGTPTILSHFQV